MIEALEIDPFDSDHWLYGTGLTIMGGNDLTSWDTVHNVSIETLANGVEEMAVEALSSVPGGSELLVAVGDDSGFTYLSSSSLGTAPSINWMTPEFTTSTDVDYAGLTVADIVRSGDTSGTNQIGVSSNGGNTWRYVHPVSNISVPLISSRGMEFAPSNPSLLITRAC
jgi:xyloglucan-specific exo-beta-1,4-glucanase